MVFALLKDVSRSRASNVAVVVVVVGWSLDKLVVVIEVIRLGERHGTGGEESDESSRGTGD